MIVIINLRNVNALVCWLLYFIFRAICVDFFILFKPHFDVNDSLFTELTISRRHISSSARKRNKRRKRCSVLICAIELQMTCVAVTRWTYKSLCGGRPIILIWCMMVIANVLRITYTRVIVNHVWFRLFM